MAEACARSIAMSGPSASRSPGSSGGGGGAVLGRRAVVAGAEGDGDETPVASCERRASPRAGSRSGRRSRQVDAVKARRQRGGVVGDDEIAAAGRVATSAARGRCLTLPPASSTRSAACRAAGTVGGDHARTSTGRAARAGKAARDGVDGSRPRPGRALQRRRVGIRDRPARAAACPCRPGRSRGSGRRRPAASSPQIAVRWASAALLAP